MEFRFEQIKEVKTIQDERILGLNEAYMHAIQSLQKDYDHQLGQIKAYCFRDGSDKVEIFNIKK